MSHRRSALLAALGLTAVAAVAAVVPTAAGAIDQDLVVSTVAGPPGTEITASSASCVSTDAVETYLDVSLIVGTAPNDQLAAVASDIDGTTKLTVPDWVDPALPAVIEASCSAWNVDTQVLDELDYDPVAFDLEPGVGPAVQVRSLSRTELLGGQAFRIDGSCGSVSTDEMVSAVVVEGTDQSGRGGVYPVTNGYGASGSDGAFELPVVVSNATVYIASAGADSTIESLGTSEEPLQIEPGDYTVFTSCHIAGSASYVMLEPATISVTGAAPTGEVELTAGPDGTNGVAMAGACDADVAGTLDGLSLDDLIDAFEGPDDAVRTAGRSPLLTLARSADDGDIEVRDRRAGRGSVSRLVASEETTDFGATPDAGGAWRHDDEAAFDQGVVIGQGTCGDPFADGFVYDPQGVVVDVTEAPVTTTTTTVTTTVPPTAPPADAVTGTPAYAG